MTNWNYKRTIDDKNNVVLEHRHIAEKMLKRSLTPEEIVHHIDNNSENNLENNLMIFKSQSDHMRFHKGGIAVLQKNGAYECMFSKPTRKCNQCGKDTINKKFCSLKCFHLFSEKVQRPSKSELQFLINKFSWVELGRQFKVSDKAIRKWAKKYKLI